jgi:hypothetical protein
LIFLFGGVTQNVSPELSDEVGVRQRQAIEVARKTPLGLTLSV